MKDPSFIRPIVITANSSSYLVHYRKLLIKNLNLKNQVITILRKIIHLSLYQNYLLTCLGELKEKKRS